MEVKVPLNGCITTRCSITHPRFCFIWKLLRIHLACEPQSVRVSVRHLRILEVQAVSQSPGQLSYSMPSHSHPLAHLPGTSLRYRDKHTFRLMTSSRPQFWDVTEFFCLLIHAGSWCSRHWTGFAEVLKWVLFNDHTENRFSPCTRITQICSCTQPSCQVLPVTLAQEPSNQKKWLAPDLF